MPTISSRMRTAAAVAAAAPIIYASIKALLHYQRHCCLPRGFRRGRFTVGPPANKSSAVDRDGYTKRKAQIDDLDVVVIGSGMGGLMCAGLLSRAGLRCLVLEQHYVAGGCMHMFDDQGYEFDTGLHYVGNIEKRKKYLDLVLQKPLQWEQMGCLEDGFAYDEIVVGPNGQETSVKVPAGRAAYVDAIEAAFPGSRAMVERWVDFCMKVIKSDTYIELKLIKPVWLARLINFFISANFFKWTKQCVVDEIKNFIPSDARLRAVLMGIFGNYASKPSEASVYIHATVAMHYLGGGYYPQGGSIGLAREMIPTIERTGGRVLVRKAVKQIMIENGRAVGVVMENGDEIRSRYVVSACGAANTWKRLVPSTHVPRGILAKIEEVGMSATLMYLFVGLDAPQEQLQLPSRNIWRWPCSEDHDLDAMISAFQADPAKAPVPLFIGFPSAKDPTFAERFPGKSTAVLLTIGSYDWFSKWESTTWGKRGQEYNDFKKMLETRILEEGLHHMWPQTRGHVTYTSLATSLSYNHFIGSMRGEAYGLNSKADRFDPKDWLRPETAVPGLYMTGQDVAVFGFAGAVMSGVLTAMSMLNYGSVLDLLSGRNIVEDLWHLDASEASQFSERSKAHHAKAYAR